MMGAYGRSSLVFLCSCLILLQQNMGWAIPIPVFYRSFDTTDGLTLMAGTQVRSAVGALVPGRSNMGVKLDATKRQWIDLGPHPEACLAQPDTCLLDGGAVSFWVKVPAGVSHPGLMSSKKTERARGFQIGYNYVGLVASVWETGGYYAESNSVGPPTGWNHIVLNFRTSRLIRFPLDSPSALSVYVNTYERLRDNRRLSEDSEAGDGRIVLGRAYSEIDDFYTTMLVNEVSFYNKHLVPEDINVLFRDGLRFVLEDI